MSLSDTPIIVDSDALIALVNIDDALSGDAMRIAEHLRNIKATLLYPATTIAETATTFQRKLNRPDLAGAIVASINAKQFIIEPVDTDILAQAAQLFHPHGSKQNTLFDAIVAAVAIKHNTKFVFAFDKWYETVGLKLLAQVV
jgi:predicted nucleic acid-binding protein